MTELSHLKRDLKILTRPDKVEIFKRFFKTGPGEYGEGDQFLGITVPQVRSVVNKYKNLSLLDIGALLQDPYHEIRLTALLILVAQYRKADLNKRKEIANLYLANTKFINNWDLIDLTAPHIIGPQLRHKGKPILIKLALSKNIWERRIAILATFDYIRIGHFNTVLRICKILVKDKEDLIHKATGWMLREIGKRDLVTEERFLKRYYRTMPRTMLRYAIEKFPEVKRQAYLKGRI